MRMLVLLFFVACSPSEPASCVPGSCPTGDHCVTRLDNSGASCVLACTADGGCVFGTCTCRPYPNGGTNCVQVCL